jgi:hypothetical protein
MKSSHNVFLATLTLVTLTMGTLPSAIANVSINQPQFAAHNKSDKFYISLKQRQEMEFSPEQMKRIELNNISCGEKAKTISNSQEMDNHGRQCLLNFIQILTPEQKQIIRKGLSPQHLKRFGLN